MGGARSLVLAGVFALATSHGALAADLFGSPPAEPITYGSDPTELGTGWYLRGDLGMSQQNMPRLNDASTKSKDQSGWLAGVGVGYQLNNWFRTDLTFNYHQTQSQNTAGTTNYVCPYSPNGLTDQATGDLLGYLWSPQAGTCNSHTSASMRQMDLMLNGYVDLGTWGGFTPYVGAGLGVARLDSNASVNYFKTSDGSVYSADLSPSGNYPFIWVNPNGVPVSSSQTVIPGTNTQVAFAKQNWLRAATQVRYNFAWSLMAGLAYNLTSRAKIDIGFRYANLGQFTALPGITTAGGSSTTITSKEVRVGFRYLID